MNVNTSRDRLIALSLLPFLTPNRTRLLLEVFDPVALASDASAALLQGLLSVTPEQAEQVRNPLTVDVLARVATLRDRVITLDDEAYPTLLREIIDPPLALHFRGDTTLLARPAVAIVGSRRASPYGVNAAETLARQIAGAGIVIVSGGARGIDAAAHHAALDVGGATIAVLGTGIDIVYPSSNRRLFRRIEEHGLIVSEFPPGTPPKPENFPIRNRVISGLARGTVIVEATSRSGSLITARMAAEQGRDVFAVPGSIFSAGSEGTHRLIQYGAKLVHDANDVLEEFPGGLRATQAQEIEPESPLKEVLAVLSKDDGAHVDTVAARVGRTPALVAESLLQLELEGWIRALPGARYVRVR
ncbi:MAG TPA: DNA-processing protein DprA [Thermoanaerobaculia bacterium]|jgi:DNA processing protein|nr:DNA-processing protein DprA [Thermoanaerobaculia bacterium]